MLTAHSLPLPVTNALKKLGRDLALARRKRRISAADMAARIFVSRDTLWRMERGDPAVSVGAFSTALFVLGLKDRFERLAEPGEDELGMALDEERIPRRIRKRKEPS